MSGLGSTLAATAARASITLMAPSKTYNTAGLGFAYAIIPDGTLRRKFIAQTKILPQSSCFALIAAEAIYSNPQSEQWRQSLLRYLRANLALVEEYAVRFAVHGLVLSQPTQATYLAWLDARALTQSLSTQRLSAHHFFEQAGVGLSDGEPFGAPGFVRLNFACPRQVLLEGLERMSAALAKHGPARGATSGTAATAGQTAGPRSAATAAARPQEVVVLSSYTAPSAQP
jgi:cystathionine beta-lyase